MIPAVWFTLIAIDSSSAYLVLLIRTTAVVLRVLHSYLASSLVVGVIIPAGARSLLCSSVPSCGSGVALAIAVGSVFGFRVPDSSFVPLLRDAAYDLLYPAMVFSSIPSRRHDDWREET